MISKAGVVRFLNAKRQMAFVFFVIFLILMFMVGNVAEDRNTILEEVKDFQEAEKLKIEDIKDYIQLSILGIGIYYLPSPMAFLSPGSSGLMADAQGHINTVEKLEIKKNLKGKAVINPSVPISLDYSGLLLMVLSIGGLYFGYESLRETETLRSLSSASTAIGSYSKVILENLGVMVLLVAAVYGGTWLVLEGTQVNLTASDIYWLMYHALAGVILATFFFFAGTSIQLM
ncbi:MAG: hypothetical protein GY940_30970, partial [bacterium]|nr:hypothetical protein [bacterium]